MILLPLSFSDSDEPTALRVVGLHPKQRFPTGYIDVHTETYVAVSTSFITIRYRVRVVAADPRSINDHKPGRADCELADSLGALSPRRIEISEARG